MATSTLQTRRWLSALIPYLIGAVGMGAVSGFMFPDRPVVYLLLAFYILGGLPAVLLVRGARNGNKSE
jgi:hypothetical protein